MSLLLTLAARELSMVWARGGGAVLAVAFFVAAVVMLPLALGPAPQGLAAVSGGVTWVVLALASLLSLERLFERDFEDGALDLLALGAVPLEVVAVVKCLAQWVVSGLPLAAAAPVVSIALGAPPRTWLVTAETAVLGSLAFAFLGGIGAALTLASRRGSLLIAVIVLPLMTPPVIFGGATLTAAAQGVSPVGPMALLGAYALAAVALTPWAMAGACRNAQS